VVGQSFWFYAGKLTWPDPLAFIYPRWEIASSHWWSYMPLAAALAVVVILWSLRARIGRGACAALAIFLIVLLADLCTASAVRLHDTFVADHLQYPAALALIALAAAVLVYAIRRLAPDATLALVLVSIIVLAPLVVVAQQRTHAFHDRIALDRDTIARNPSA